MYLFIDFFLIGGRGIFGFFCHAGIAHAFRILNPQKSILVAAPSLEVKRQWLGILTRSIEIIVEKRSRFLQGTVFFQL